MFQQRPIHLIIADAGQPPFEDEHALHEWLNGFFELQMVVRCTPFLIGPPKQLPQEQAQQ